MEENNKKLDKLRELIGDETFEEINFDKKKSAGRRLLKSKKNGNDAATDDYESDEFEDEEYEEVPGEKKKHPWRTALLIFMALVVLICAVGVGAAVITLNRINRSDWSNEEKVDPSQEDFDSDDGAGENTVDPDDVNWDEVKVFSHPDVKNILLIGQDRRPGEKRARSDSMIICSLNQKTGVVTLVSLMRDMYVPIPGYSDNRINAAYAFGGMTLLNQVIKEDLGIIIDGNVEVDFDGFIQVMGMVAPLNIELKSNEAAKVLTAAFNKLRSMPVSTIYNVVNAALPCVTTDMSNLEIMGYVSTVIARGVNIGESYWLPASGTYSDEIIRGMMVLVPDLPANSRILQRYLYGDLMDVE